MNLSGDVNSLSISCISFNCFRFSNLSKLYYTRTMHMCHTRQQEMSHSVSSWTLYGLMRKTFSLVGFWSRSRSWKFPKSAFSVFLFLSCPRIHKVGSLFLFVSPHSFFSIPCVPYNLYIWTKYVDIRYRIPYRQYTWRLTDSFNSIWI